jgi:hypothetical protein
MVTTNPQKSAPKYSCEKCNINCSKKNDYYRHILTQKHQGNTKGNTDSANPVFTCERCKKDYKSRKGLWCHNKTCNSLKYNVNENIIIENTTNENIVVDTSNNEMVILTNLVLELVKSNNDLQKQVLDVCKTIQPGTINNNNINTINNNNNKTFNLQVFLNEECKDAMNLSDFVKSFKLQLSDLELVGDEGFINGMTKVILAKLDGMDANTRPFHCTDLKRETVYVKEDDVWVREGPDNAKLTAAIKAIGHQNFFILKEYKALHPDCESTYSEFNDHYMNLIMKSAGCQKEDIAKVIKKLVKEIVIVK